MNARNAHGETALRIAIANKRSKTEAFLRDRGAHDTGADDLFKAAGPSDTKKTEKELEQEFIAMLEPSSSRPSLRRCQR